MRKTCDWAEKGSECLLAIEIIDDPFINSIEKYLAVEKRLTLLLFVYPDIGNVSAWHNDVYSEFYLGLHAMWLSISGYLCSDRKFKGRFRDVTFGQGCVKWEEAFDILKQANYKGPF